MPGRPTGYSTPPELSCHEAAQTRVNAAFLSAVPGKKEGPPDDLVGTILLLASRAGDWINGQVISVDGGWIMRV